MATSHSHKNLIQQHRMRSYRLFSSSTANNDLDSSTTLPNSSSTITPFITNTTVSKQKNDFFLQIQQARQLYKPSYPKCSVILTNLQSATNIGRILRNCLAFNVFEVLVVGKKDFKQKLHQADRGAKHFLSFQYFPTLTLLNEYLHPNTSFTQIENEKKEEFEVEKKKESVRIIGVEISDESIPLHKLPIKDVDHTVFMFGNEGTGLSEKQRSICDGFVYIPQYAFAGMGSINVACASAIVLHHFASHAEYTETKRQGEKFLITPELSENTETTLNQD